MEVKYGPYIKYINYENLRKERFIKRISAKKLAEILGKGSPQSYLNFETGKIEPKISDISKIIQFYNRPVQYFFNLEVKES